MCVRLSHIGVEVLLLLNPQPLLCLSASRRLTRKLESLCLIRVIETGPPETKELLNCYPLAHLKDHFIKPFCLCVFILILFFLFIVILLFAEVFK